PFVPAGRAAGVIVRARMNGSRLARRQGILTDQAEMIVMCADDHVLAGLAGQVSNYVMHGLHGPYYVRGAVDLDAAREFEGVGLHIVIDRVFDLLQVLARLGVPFGGKRLLHLKERNAPVVRPRRGAESLQFVGIAWMVDPIVNQNHRRGLVQLRIRGLVGELRMACQWLALEGALLLRLMPQD